MTQTSPAVAGGDPVAGDIMSLADPVSVIEAIRENRRQCRVLEAQEVALLAHCADLCAMVCDGEAGHLPGAEQLVELGGDGTPGVAEFATLELAAALGVREIEARCMVADALDLRHRLPELWRQTMAGELPVWRARHIAGATRRLEWDAARLVDVQLARQIPGMAWGRVKNLVAGLVLDHLPVEEADQQRADAKDARGVWISQGEFGIADLSAVMDAPDADRLEQSLTRIAGILKAGGSRDGLDARRAKALGMLASPARALQLLQASLLDTAVEELPGLDVTADCHLEGQPGHCCGTIAVDPTALAPRTSLVVHLTDTTLCAGEGIVRAEGIGPLLAEWLHDLIPDAVVTVRPVIDGNHEITSDAYECPPTMREQVELRNPYEVFPWSTRRSRSLDLDHTIPFGRGPTRTDNLGPLTRKVHRAKTHGGYRLEQPIPGHFLWQTPLGFRYLVTPSRTLELGRPDVCVVA
ncbi:DUF222 domain-containing protein [Luteococcus sp. Sow4_B9]|uniref:DUF222 domain-containing protein n=1 Tax=Luteococcus sp. Sow4_B9 TaxID=3438792 RepID=UPI003F9AAE11